MVAISERTGDTVARATHQNINTAAVPRIQSEDTVMRRTYRGKHVLQVDSPLAHVMGGLFGAFMATCLGFIFWMVVSLMAG